MALRDALRSESAASQSISLQLADPNATRRAHHAIALNVFGTEGLSLPLEMLITGPSAATGRRPPKRHTYRKLIPSRVSFIPREGGEHLVVLREQNNDRTWGYLLVTVTGTILKG